MQNQHWKARKWQFYNYLSNLYLAALRVTLISLNIHTLFSSYDPDSFGAQEVASVILTFCRLND